MEDLLLDIFPDLKIGERWKEWYTVVDSTSLKSVGHDPRCWVYEIQLNSVHCVGMENSFGASDSFAQLGLFGRGKFTMLIATQSDM